MMNVVNREVDSRCCARNRLSSWLWLGVLLLTCAGSAAAQDASKSSMEIYGFTMMDMGHDFKTIDPDWFDTMRVTKLPSFDGQFGENHSTFAGVRQSRFGAKTTTPTSFGDLNTTFEFEMFGVGVDAGQTTIRLRHAYGELGQFGAGQTWSPFMDPDVFPNSLEYWGPTGMVFYRNVQVRWMPLKGDKSFTLALERPGASGDPGRFEDRIEIQNIRARFPYPDITAQYTYGDPKWGYVRAAAAVRRINWDDTLDDAFDLDGDATGWGVNLSSNINLGANKRDVIRLQFVIGEGIENYMNDAPVDIAPVLNLGDPVRPIKGDPLPLTGIVAFIDHKWSEKWMSTGGYSRVDIDNVIGQRPDAFRVGEYALANLVYYPVPNVMVGGEFQWGRRENFSDGFRRDGAKVQFSFRYNFSHKIGG
jgi:hypothetical protein